MVLVIKHVPGEGPGLLAEMFDGRGIRYTVLEAYRKALPLSPAGLWAVVSMGGPMSVNDRLPPLEREKGFLQEAMGRGLPVLGICLGAQLVASALGSRVYPGPEPEIGWGEVALTQEGRRDRLFSGVEDILQVLHWHGETYELPPGAVGLASSSAYPEQAFRWKENVYGLQFHLETTREMVRMWTEGDGAREEGGCRAAVRKGIDDRLPRVQLNASLVFGRFIDRVLKRPDGPF